MKYERVSTYQTVNLLEKSSNDFEVSTYIVSIWRTTTWAAHAVLFHFEGYSIVQDLTPMCNQNIQRTKDFGNTSFYSVSIAHFRLNNLGFNYDCDD